MSTHRRTGTYVAFHAGGTSDPSASDQKYYRLLTAWTSLDSNDLHFVDSHTKTDAVRDSSKRETLQRALVTRLRRSKNMILIMTDQTRLDTDWVPFEITYAIDTCEIPLIVAYPGYDWICKGGPDELKWMWPPALTARLGRGVGRAIHVPFKERPLASAVGQFDMNNMPNSSRSYYGYETYKGWGLAS